MRVILNYYIINSKINFRYHELSEKNTILQCKKGEM